MDKLDYRHLNHWAKSMMAKGKSPKTIHNVHRLISAARTSQREWRMGAVLPGSGNNIIVAGGANASLPSSAATAAVAGAAVVLVQILIPAAAAEAALPAGQRTGAVTIPNAAPTEQITESILRLADIVVVNKTEVAALGGAAGCSAGANIGSSRETRRKPSDS